MSTELTWRDLPFEVPPVHVDALWHRRAGPRADHQWLRQAVSDASSRALAAQADKA